MKLLLPDWPPMAPTLPAEVEVHRYDARERVPEELRDAEAVVLWGNSDERLRELAQDLHAVRWVQGLMSGMDRVIAAGFSPHELTMSSGQGTHDGPVAEHALALILAATRRLDLARDDQRAHVWATRLSGRQPLDNSEGLRTLRGASVLIWGFGSIGRRLAPMLTLLGAEVRGVATSAGERDGYPVFDVASLPELLPTTDLLVSIIPGTAANRHALDARLIGLLPSTAWVVNVGRGGTIDEDALIDALRAGRLGGAALDVVGTEPLPADSPLWDQPGVILTPHIAGARPLGADELIEHNARAYLAGAELRNAVAPEGAATRGTVHEKEAQG
jgi:phosphoglycerate dehydrogenase-like enzyme